MNWIKSSHSGTWPEGNCVELRIVRPVPGGTGCTFCGGDGNDGAGHECPLCHGSGGRS